MSDSKHTILYHCRLGGRLEIGLATPFDQNNAKHTEEKMVESTNVWPEDQRGIETKAIAGSRGGRKIKSAQGARFVTSAKKMGGRISWLRRFYFRITQCSTQEILQIARVHRWAPM